MSSQRRPTTAPAAHPALLEMLDSLLAEVPAESPAPEAAPPPPAPAVPVETTAPAGLNITDTPPLQRTRECVIHGAEQSPRDTPESRFSAILFSVGRYRFATSLNALDSVTRVTERPTEIFGQPDWHRGVVRHRGGQLVLVDPGRLLGLRDAEPVEQPDHVLVLPGGRYGLLSSQPPEPVTLQGGGIHWSRPNPRRLWLAGLLPEQMCALVDAEVLAEMIQA